MRVRQSGWVGTKLKLAVAAAVGLGMVCAGFGVARAQNPPGKKAINKVRSKVRNQGGVPLKKALPNAADPLAKADAGAGPPEKEKSALTGSFHYVFKLAAY